MRRITLSEQRKILTVLAQAHLSAGMMETDAICYGGPLENYRDQREYLWKATKAFPADVIKAFNAEIAKHEADRLRAKADRIEKGLEKAEL